MSETVSKDKPRVGVSYVVRKARKGDRVFSDVTLPNGSIVRRVDKEVHERALRRVAEKYREIKK